MWYPSYRWPAERLRSRTIWSRWSFTRWRTATESWCAGSDETARNCGTLEPYGLTDESISFCTDHWNSPQTTFVFTIITQHYSSRKQSIAKLSLWSINYLFSISLQCLCESLQSLTTRWRCNKPARSKYSRKTQDHVHLIKKCTGHISPQYQCLFFTFK